TARPRSSATASRLVASTTAARTARGSTACATSSTVRRRRAPHTSDGRSRALLPDRRDQPALAVGRHRDSRLVELDAIPQLAGDLLVLLVERLAVVRVLAAP